MTNSPVQKEFQSQLVKWGFWALVALCGSGLVAVANRNVYSKAEVDERDSQVRIELRHYQELQLLQHDQVVSKIDDLKTTLDEVRRDVKERP